MTTPGPVWGIYPPCGGVPLSLYGVFKSFHRGLPVSPDGVLLVPVRGTQTKGGNHASR